MPNEDTENPKMSPSRDRSILAALIGAARAIVAAAIAVIFAHSASTNNSGPDRNVRPTSLHPTSPAVSPTSAPPTQSTSQTQGVAAVRNVLMQASDLGTGWVPTQIPTGAPATCPTVSQRIADDASVAFSDGNNATVIEEVVQTANASSVVSEYKNTANGCSYTKQDESGLTSTFTYQADDTAPDYGTESDVFTIGGANMPGETPTIDGYSAVIRNGNEVAIVGIAVGLYNEPSESTVFDVILPTAARRLR